MIELEIERPSCTFSLKFSGKYNFILGDSATKKSLIVETLEQFMGGSLDIAVKGILDGSEVNEENLIIFVNGGVTRLAITALDGISNCICIVDETSGFWKAKNIASVLKRSENYFIFITRKIPRFLPASIDSIFRIEKVNGVHINVPVYCSKNSDLFSLDGAVSHILTEDSKSSREFFLNKFESLGVQVCTKTISHKGKEVTRTKDLLVPELLEELESGLDNMLIVFDAAAFGRNYQSLLDVLHSYKDRNICVLSWDSYENYLLQCKPFKQQLNKENVKCLYSSLEELSKTTLYECIDYREGEKMPIPPCLTGNSCSSCQNVCQYYSDGNEYFEYPITEIKVTASQIPRCKQRGI